MKDIASLVHRRSDCFSCAKYCCVCDAGCRARPEHDIAASAFRHSYSLWRKKAWKLPVKATVRSFQKIQKMNTTYKLLLLLPRMRETKSRRSLPIDALSEIHGEKSFPCSECGKVCKSKGGLTRHINSKHSDTPLNTTSSESVMFCFDTIASIVESIKSQIMREKLYGSAMNDLVNTASCTQAFFDALFPLYADFCRRKNQDKLVESVFSLMPQSCKLLKSGCQQRSDISWQRSNFLFRLYLQVCYAYRSCKSWRTQLVQIFLVFRQNRKKTFLLYSVFNNAKKSFSKF